MQNPQYVKQCAGGLKKRLPAAFANIPPCGIILGTGLSAAAKNILAGAVEIPFTDLPYFPVPKVQSHEGKFLAGTIGGMPVLAQQGRCHLYEGRSPAEVCMGVRLMGLIGCREIIITNAAGALNPLFQPGRPMLMADIINYTGVSPLAGLDDGEFGPRFPDMSAPFDAALTEMARQCALAKKITLYEGVYIGVHGPEMETPAETRMYRQWGADAVGMSTVLEIIAARQMNLQCLGISCLTNKNLPDCMKPAPIEEVLRVAAEAANNMAELLSGILEILAKKKYDKRQEATT